MMTSQSFAALFAAALALGAPLPACSRQASGRMVELRGPTTDTHELVPAPRSVLLSLSDSFAFTPRTAVVLRSEDAAALRVGRYLAELIGGHLTGTPLQVETGRLASRRGNVALELGRSDTLGEEGYELTITSEGVTLSANTPAGLFYAFQTLRQLLPADVERRAMGSSRLAVPAGRVVDGPRFAWRGAMLDVSRHFLQPQAVKRYIDHMALYKLNRLHLHLSDDQGWRIEVKSWPNLTRHGGSTQVGGGPGGYYTQEQYADLVRYAHDRFITVVPEIDMPGHTNAALASYAELNCDNKAPALYTGTRVGFSALCVQRETTYKFIDDVVREIAALTPGPYFHVGGDEVERLSDDQYRRFVERVEGIVRAHGKRMIGWGEIAPANLHVSTIVQQWRPRVAPTAAVERGNKVILSPADKIYLDMKYDSTTQLGLMWAAVVEVRDSYDWEPATLLPGVGADAILGIEAPLWSETVATIRDFEFLAFPRLPAVAEVGWSQQDRRSWPDFRQRLGAHGPRWQILNINFYKSPQVPWRE